MAMLVYRRVTAFLQALLGRKSFCANFLWQRLLAWIYEGCWPFFVQFFDLHHWAHTFLAASAFFGAHDSWLLDVNKSPRARGSPSLTWARRLPTRLWKLLVQNVKNTVLSGSMTWLNFTSTWCGIWTCEGPKRKGEVFVFQLSIFQG